MSNFNFDFWFFMAGLGIFLYGMFHLEIGLKGMAGKSFKKLLQKFSDKTWKGILTGTFATSILQSSSVVSLLVLAMLGGGVISLKNALGIVLGANIGTTFTAWIVTSLGFSFAVSELSYPLLTIGVLSFLLFDKRPFLKNLGGFLMGFGMLFLGIDFMKESITELTAAVDFNQLAAYDLWVFLLVGLVLTALIQSSSAMIVIVLSVLNVDIIDLHQSVALVIGSSIGTTSTLLLGSLKGSAEKKRLSIANILFKTLSGFLAYLLIDQWIWMVSHVFQMTDNLYKLVVINTGVNLLGVALFYPFMNPFTRLLSHCFAKSNPTTDCMYINKATSEIPDIAIKAVKRELERTADLTCRFMLQVLNAPEDEAKNENSLEHMVRVEVNPLEGYDKLKRIEGETTLFYWHLHEKNLSPVEAAQLSTLMFQLRMFISAAKSMKDIWENIRAIEQSDDATATTMMTQVRHFAIRRIIELQGLNTGSTNPLQAVTGKTEFEQFYLNAMQNLYAQYNAETYSKIPFSTIANTIRKTVSALEELTVARLGQPSEP